jgi:hypothetical protein
VVDRGGRQRRLDGLDTCREHVPEEEEEDACRRRGQERARGRRQDADPADRQADEDGEPGDCAEDEDLGLGHVVRTSTFGVRHTLHSLGR